MSLRIHISHPSGGSPTRRAATLLPAAVLPAAVLAVVLLGCGSERAAEVEPAPWQVVAESAEAALLSVSGTAADDVWMVGADGGSGPAVLHWDGASWAREESGVRGDLWWVQALPSGSVYMGGSRGVVLVRRGEAFERLDTPALARHTVFGVWAAGEDDLYAVGSAAGRDGFVWHFDGSGWVDLPLPDGVARGADLPGFFKVWGSSATDVWVVGDRGVVLRGSAGAGFRLLESGSEERLFTVHGAAGRVAMVGGSGNGFALEAEVGADALVAITPPGASLLQGVYVSERQGTWAVGLGGNVYTRAAAGGEWSQTFVDTPVQTLHAVWLDPDGGAWAVGGNALTDALDGGVALHQGQGRVLPVELPPRPPPAPRCPELAIDPVPGASVARRWNEQLLGAIRRDLPRAPVHARNLFHVSVAMWDAWAAYDAVADGYATSERQGAEDVDGARREAISFAAYRVLRERYRGAHGGAVSQACFDAFMRALGYDPLDAGTTGDTPRALGNRVGLGVLDAFAADGANEAADYADPEGFRGDAPALAVDLPGTVLVEPLRWQPLLLADAETPNGIELGSGVQTYLVPHWGAVTPFALARAEPSSPYLEPGRAPAVLDADLLQAVVEVIRQSGERDPVRRASVEYWMNGPENETPPGHWNVLANAVAADPRHERRPFGSEPLVDALAWDVRVYLALNGALHDAAIAAWELKRRSLSARPITLIRHLSALGQRSQPDAPGHDPGGLPLVEGSIEPISEASSAEGAAHAGLRRYVGEVALRAWPGQPGDSTRGLSPVTWVRGKEWMPYQPRAVVSPASPGYVADVSAFSGAAARVLHELSGSDTFPGGAFRVRVEPERFVIEAAPAQAVELEWATYYDAATQAGAAGTWSGTQFGPDDVDGRRLGESAGALAVARARAYFDGSARP